MAFVSYLINKIYNEYGDQELFFNKSVINVTGLEPKKVFLKVKNEQWPCVLYSCSMKFARIIMTLDPDAFDVLKNVNNFVNLRFSFFREENKKSVMFYVPANIDGYRNLNEKYKNVYLVYLNFTQKPSDDLIEILGDFEKRGDIRIALNDKIIKDIGFDSTNIIAEIDMIKRSCILRNLSTAGASILLQCMPKFLIGKEVALHLKKVNSNETIRLNGKLNRFDKVEGRRDIYELGISFIQKNIPLEFKKTLNEYYKKLEIMAKNK